LQYIVTVQSEAATCCYMRYYIINNAVEYSLSVHNKLYTYIMGTDLFSFLFLWPSPLQLGELG